MKVRQRTGLEPLEPHLALVRHLARRVFVHAHPYLEMGDLIGIGTEALLRAAGRYDPKRGVPFGTFAYLRVRGAMCEGIGVVGPATRGVIRKRPGRAKRRSTPPWLLRPDHFEPAVARRDICESAAIAIDTAHFGPRIDEALKTLGHRERMVIARHYVVGDTLCAIGRDLGRSRSWASRIHASALASLRAALLPTISAPIRRPGLDSATAVDIHSRDPHERPIPGTRRRAKLVQPVRLDVVRAAS